MFLFDMRKLACLTIAASGLVVGCRRSAPAGDAPAQPAQARSAAAVVTDKEEEPVTRLKESMTKLKESSTTLADAVNLVKPDIEQKQTDWHNLSARRLAFWAVGNLKWADVAVPKNESSAGMIIKDPETSAGKRLCLRGRIIEIHKRNLEEGRECFWGLLGTYSDDLVSFWAIGDTGELVAGRSARFCGVAAGKFMYKNRQESEDEAVEIVGIFDLPSNKPAPSHATAEVAATKK